MDKDEILVTDPDHLKAVLASQVTMKWYNTGSAVVGPFVRLRPIRHEFQPVAVATKEQLKKGRRT